MISKRSAGSLAQLLEHYDADFVVVLFSKHGLDLSLQGNSLIRAVNSALADERNAKTALAVVEEVVRTNGDHGPQRLR